MRKIIILAFMLLGISAAAVEITDEAKSRAAELVAQMTLEEKLAYVGGHDGFYIRAVPRLGIPLIRMADGPQGVRNNTQSTLFPCGIALASTWNRELAYAYGQSLGNDARERGVNILLGPGVNIYRSPLCGRNFEYMGEDPYLASQTAVQYICGVQSRGVMATVKHFCGNNQEWSRHQVSSDIDERTLNEIYLATFRRAVKEAKVGAVMSSYNLVNSVHMSENKELVVELLRKKWGFEGIHMSDWHATYSTVGAANNGLDLEMGEAIQMTPERLRAAIESGRVSIETIDEKCQHILQTLISFGFLDATKEFEPTTPSDQVALAVAREAVILLKNDGILPLTRKQRNIAVLGPNANVVPTGGGSGFVTPISQTTILEAMQTLDKKLKVSYITNASEDASAISKADVVVYCAGLNSDVEGEDHDRAWELPSSQLEEIELACKLNPHTVVVINAGGGVDMMPFIDKAAAVLMAWYTGQCGGEAIADIISGKANPSGRLPISLERKAEDNPCFNSYKANVPLPYSWGHPMYRVSYDEGVFMGYRGYDKKQLEPLFPFGYGLSYTEFDYSDMQIDGDTVSFTVKNVGKREGATVAQVYLGAVDASVPRPLRELKGYQKVSLKPGEEKRVEIKLDRDAFEYYNLNAHDFVFEAGQFVICVGESSRDIRLETILTINN